MPLPGIFFTGLEPSRNQDLVPIGLYAAFFQCASRFEMLLQKSTAEGYSMPLFPEIKPFSAVIQVLSAVSTRCVVDIYVAPPPSIHCIRSVALPRIKWSLIRDATLFFLFGLIGGTFTLYQIKLKMSTISG